MEPWARRDDESAKAYEAFRTYLELGSKRSIRTTCESLNKSVALLGRWSSKYEWPSRAAAYDSVPVQAAVEAHADMAKRIAAQHDRVATKLLDRLERNLDRIPEGADPSIRWSTAHNAARQGHNFAADLTTPKDTAREEITKAIENLINKLAGE